MEQEEKNMEKKKLNNLINQTMDFLGMLGFVPSKDGNVTARKWLKNMFIQAYNEGKLAGLEKSKEIIWEK
jgi:hypothetical protein